jgi:uncharacterized protein (DUF427 family)
MVLRKIALRQSQQLANRSLHRDVRLELCERPYVASPILLAAKVYDMRPPSIPQPGEDQESVWDYPRPPRLEQTSDRLRVLFAGETIADTTAGFRVLETSHPPVYYIPPGDIVQRFIEEAPGSSWCEFKGHARYWSIAVGARRSYKAAWSYEKPTPGFEAIAGHLAFYASHVDECRVGDEQVQAQEGDFYGGWITSRIVGPFKGGAGTLGW